MVPPPASATAPAPSRTRGGLTSLPPRDPAAERTARLFEDHHREVLRFLRRRDPDLAEDALSETFAVAVRRAADIPHGRELPWLYVVADHVLRNLQRSRRRAARVPEALHPFTHHTADAADVPFVGDALAELPDRERILLTMTAFEGLTATEAADRMGIPYGSARNALSSGRKRLAVVLAAAAGFLLVIGAISAIAGHLRGRQPLESLASTLSDARVVHDVAMISHDGQPATAGGRPAGTRYERWTDGSGDRTRVRLPGGKEVVATRGETLRGAVRQQIPAGATPAQRRAVRQDLMALDASSPSAIAALLADPIAQRTLADGPSIAGHDTTTVHGEIRDAAGVAHDVRVYVADDQPIVVRVRVSARVGRGTDDERAGAVPAATVDFLEWNTVPLAASGGGNPTTPTSPIASTPAIVPPPASPTTPLAPTTPVPAAAAAGAGTAVGVPAAAKTGGNAGAGSTQHRDAPKTDTTDTTNSGDSRAKQGDAKPKDPKPNPALASAPIVHVRQKVTTCLVDPAGREQCLDYGDREVWFEQSARQRSLSRAIRRTGQIRNEEWRTATQRNYWTVSVDGTRVHGLRERLRNGVGDTAKLPQGWRAEWWNALTPQLVALTSDPARIPALPAGPDVGGRATKLFSTTLLSTSDFDLNGPGTYTAAIAVDPATGAPLRVVLEHPFPNGGRDRVTLEVSTWEHSPAGYLARLVTGKFPKGTVMSRHS